jgi:hypothetical protein
MFKIRISCTNLDDLTFNKKKICKKNYNTINNKLQPENIDYITSIIILHKKIKGKKMTCKTLEFICNEINETQFIEFIQIMKNNDYYSNNNNIIQLIDNNNIIILNYDFKTCIKTDIIQKKKRFKWGYSTECLYKK